MVEKAEVKPADLNFDDLLQCPVCYEIPTGQIFQCNEGHHVCGQCKMRLDVCPVCRALFFGTRNYAMEELIANIRKMRSFKLGGTSRSGSSSSSTPAKDNTSAEHENNVNENEEDEEDNNSNVIERPVIGPPPACSGLFRCLCCKPGQTARLPSGRLLNHLRYYHAPHLLEGHSENGVYIQAWQFATVPGKLVTAVRISDMGVFFLTIEIEPDCVCAWLFMAAAPWVAHEFNYTISICGNDREAIFSDSVWTVRSCEGTLKKRGHCLIVRDQDARALTNTDTISGKLTVRRTPSDQLPQTQPRAVLRIANRVNSNHNSSRVSNDQNSSGDSSNQIPAFGFEPFLHELQNDVARLSRAFATLGREADALVQSEAEMSARIEAFEQAPQSSGANARASDSEAEPSGNSRPSGLSRRARRNIRRRMLAVLDEPSPPVAPPNNHVQAPSASNASTQNVPGVQPRQNTPSTQHRQNTPATQPRQNGPATQPRQNTPATQQNQNMSATELRQNTPSAQPRQNTSATQVRQNSAATQPQQNTSATQPRRDTAANQLRQNASATQPRQNTSATQPRPNSAATQPTLNSVATQPRPNSATTQLRQDNAVSQQRQNDVHFLTNISVVAEPTPMAPQPSTPSASAQQPANGSRNKKKRRQRARK